MKIFVTTSNDVANDGLVRGRIYRAYVRMGRYVGAGIRTRERAAIAAALHDLSDRLRDDLPYLSDAMPQETGDLTVDTMEEFFTTKTS